MRLLLILVLSLLMFGCCSVQPKYITRVKTITVYKAVPVVPDNLKQIPEVPRPDLAVNHLSEADKNDPDKVAKAVVASEAQLRSYISKLEENEKAFREYANQPQPGIPKSTTQIHMVE